MSNFIGMVFATLKKEGIDTSKMDTSEAIAKYNEIQGSGGGSSAKGEETPKTEQKTAETGKETVEKGTTEKDSADATVSKKETVEEETTQKSNRELKDIQSMTRVELAKELYQSYLKTGSTPIGSDKPLTEQQYIKRYLSGVGASNGFSKQALQDLVQESRNGKYGGSDINKQTVSNSPNTAEKMSTAMGISPDEAKAFATGKGSLTKGGYEGVSNVNSAPTFEYKTQEQNLSKEAEDWANTSLSATVKKTPTENLQKIIGYWEEIYKVQNDAYSAKMLEVYSKELQSRK